MPEAAVLFERLQPSLLDRLTDNAPEEQKETRNDRVIDVRRLREIVQRDLGWLLNTYNNSIEIDPELYPHASRSVLSFGVQDIAGGYATGDRVELIRKSIRKAIEVFEPRLRSGSVDVQIRVKEGEEARNPTVSFDIRADMWAEPVPMELYMRTDVDLTTGDVAIERPG
jgi:type VI secretion system protein ImpF